MALFPNVPIATSNSPESITNLSDSNIPSGIVTVMGSGFSVDNSALLFGGFNSFTSTHPIEFNGERFLTGPTVSVPTTKVSELEALVQPFLNRAKAYNPAVNDSLREPNVFMFALTSFKAVLILTDGISYAEAKLGTYVLTPDEFTPTFDSTQMTVITNKTGAQPGVSRTSLSGDEPTLRFADVVVSPRHDKISVVLNRAFGNLQGWVSFNLNLAMTSISKGEVHPAKLFNNTDKIDLTEDVLPPMPFGNVGVFVHRSSSEDFRMNILGGVEDPVSDPAIYSPFEYPDEHTFSLPTGSGLILRGTTYLLERPMSVGYSNGYHKYIYVVRDGDNIKLQASTVMREPSSFEVMVADVSNGVKLVDSYVVLGDKLISSERRGSAIPVFEDDGGLGINSFFKLSDKIS